MSTAIFNERKLAAQGQSQTTTKYPNAAAIISFWDCGLSNHTFIECFSDCLKCPPGTLCHRHRTQACVYKPIFRKQSEIATKSAREAIAAPSELPVFRLDDLTSPLNDFYFTRWTRNR